MKYACTGIKYVVKEGDTLYKISRKYDIPLAVILRNNVNIDIYNIKPGEIVCIPYGYVDIIEDMNDFNNKFDDMYIYVVKEGDSLKDILEKYSINIDELMSVNDEEMIILKVGTMINIPKK